MGLQSHPRCTGSGLKNADIHDATVTRECCCWWCGEGASGALLSGVSTPVLEMVVVGGWAVVPLWWWVGVGGLVV